jgi:hypothetical protein
VLLLSACLPACIAGLDFGYVRHPFQPNSGKKKMADFVRRRRWIRTRVPLELGVQRSGTIAEDSSSWSVGVGAPGGGAARPSEGAAGGPEGAGGAAAAVAAADSDERQVHAMLESIFAEVGGGTTAGSQPLAATSSTALRML